MHATGLRTPVGIRVVAASPGRLTELGGALQRLAMAVPGVRGASFESLGGEPRLRFTADAAAHERLAADPSASRATAGLLVAGGQVGELELAGQRLRVRVAPEYANVGLADQLRDATVRFGAQPVALSLLGRSDYVTEPSMVRSEGGELVAYVHVDVTDETDPVGFVERAQEALRGALARRDITLGPGERVDWTGQYPLFVAGRARLLWIVPVVALVMVGLLYAQLRSFTEAAIVLASVPFGLVGSVWTLFLLGYSLSAPVWVGLLSAVGLAMQTGVVMVVYVDESFHRRLREGTLASRDDVIDAHAEGTIRRLRPKIMTVTTMGAGLLPLLWAEGAGAEILRRVAAPMLGGLLTSAFLTLEVLPVLYTMWRVHQLETAKRTGTPLSEVVGAVPPWARGSRG
jgi:Cu(I)/Ag(I) efflux system membrane protein CusA/SilA